MEYIRINHGNVIDWPLVAQVLAENPAYIAMVPSSETGKRIPENRRLVVPWLKKDLIYICTAEGAQKILDEMKLRLDVIKEAVWRDGR